MSALRLFFINSERSEQKMRIIKRISLLAATLLALPACSGSNQVEFDYVHLQNNVNGFVTDDGDTAIAIGLKKGSSLKVGIDTYLSTLTPQYWTELMGDMVALKNDENATYTSEATFDDVSAGTFKVGMECAYDPFNWTQNDDKNGAYPISNISGKFANGYDVQIAAQVASALHMKLEIYQYEWDALLPAVNSGAITGIVAGMSPTEERLEEIDFSVNYYQSNLVVITRKGNKLLEAKSLSDIDQAGVKIAAQPGTFHLDALKAQTKNLTVVENLNDFVAMRIALEAGSIDGYIAEEPTALTFCS